MSPRVTIPPTTPAAITVRREAPLWDEATLGEAEDAEAVGVMLDAIEVVLETKVAELEMIEDVDKTDAVVEAGKGETIEEVTIDKPAELVVLPCAEEVDSLPTVEG
ncbi:hypothetical protein M378DRAFT_172668 [Amanita muscaria Koide BX008]|uniref:Uncharacterized protein n=1 Tax=Amanita muscaria (strain Koide BX008) TaxID=946122 RepID=A0A0C2S1K7_AMAMK|nr:hypothetical protein M378DRAFT_172668 [Amanita muscaria Koide BX008]